MPHEPSPPTERLGRSLADLLAATARQDRAAFEELYRSTSAKLFGICLRISSSRQEAEDAAQEAYLAVWRRAGSFDAARGSAMGWLAVLTRNVAIDRLRARRGPAVPGDMPDMADDSPLALETLLADEQARRLTRCLDDLDPDDARSIRTAFFQGATYAELAERSATPLGTVKSRIRRALIRLRGCLE